MTLSLSVLSVLVAAATMLGGFALAERTIRSGGGAFAGYIVLMTSVIVALLVMAILPKLLCRLVGCV